MQCFVATNPVLNNLFTAVCNPLPLSILCTNFFFCSQDDLMQFHLAKKVKYLEMSGQLVKRYPCSLEKLQNAFPHISRSPSTNSTSLSYYFSLVKLHIAHISQFLLCEIVSEHLSYNNFFFKIEYHDELKTALNNYVNTVLSVYNMEILKLLNRYDQK